MIEPNRVLQPLHEAEPAVRTLYEYQAPDELAHAIRDVAAAIDHSLRLLLRADSSAPEELRLTALSPDQLPTDRLLNALRQRNLISLELAAAVHELLLRSGERAEPGTVRAADADAATRAVERLRAEVQSLTERGLQETAHHAVLEHPLSHPPRPVQPPRGRGMRPIAIALSVLALIALAVILILAREDPFRDGVEAFAQGRMGLAEQRFEQVIEDEPDHVSARLYLARIYRRQERYSEAGEQLERAAVLAPEDADVRRELGHLFLQLRRYDASARQYQRALELDPEHQLSWVGLIRALRGAGDPRADELLSRAPDAVRAAFGLQ